MNLLERIYVWGAFFLFSGFFILYSYKAKTIREALARSVLVTLIWPVSVAVIFVKITSDE